MGGIGWKFRCFLDDYYSKKDCFLHAAKAAFGFIFGWRMLG